MKPNYRIENNLNRPSYFFYLFNFKPLNKISIYGFYSERTLNREYLVGVWKIKHYETNR